MKEKFKNLKNFILKSGSIASRFHMEADKCAGGLSVVVGGVSSVIDFNPEIAVLKTNYNTVSILGNGLDIAVYENNTVEISGKISTLEFKYAKI